MRERIRKRKVFQRRKPLHKKKSLVTVFQSIFPPEKQEQEQEESHQQRVIRDSTLTLLTQQCKIFWEHYGGKRNEAKSFWINSFDQPSCYLEYFAQQCARYHCDGHQYLGAEYWVQYRSGRVIDSNLSDGLEFHFDKDEIACSVNGVWKHPSYSTVTYLGSNSPLQWGAPIVIFRTKSIDLPPGLKPVVNRMMTPSRAWICFPRPGVHIRFQGNLLHGVPSELNPLLYSTEDGSSSGRQYSRLSLAVNIWVKDKPVGLKRIDSTIFRELDDSTFAPCFTETTQHLQLHPVSVQQSAEESFAVFDSIRSGEATEIQSESESPQEVHYLKEHLEGDTGVIPLTPLRNEYQRICSDPSYRSRSNGIAIKYSFA